MSLYKYWWRPNIDRALKQYPELIKHKRELQEARIISSYTPTTSTGSVARGTEMLALRTLPAQEQRWIDAIEKAISETKGIPNGEVILSLIRMIYFTGRYSFSGAAMELFISESTAKRYVQKFVICVAKYAGYLEMNSTQ